MVGPVGPGSRGGNRHLDTVEDAREYAAGHPETFGGMRVSGRLVIVSFTTDLPGHLQRLQTSVAVPSMIRVEHAEYSQAFLEKSCVTIRERLLADPRQPWAGSGPGNLMLRAPFEDIAAAMNVEYGTSLSITLGLKPYPRSRIVDPQEVPVPQPTMTVTGLELTLALAGEQVTAGETLNGSVTFHNRGRTRITGMTGATLAAGLRSQGDAYMASQFVGMLWTLGMTVELASGDSQTLPLLVGTASCLPDTSYIAPPGRYEVIATIPFHPYRPSDVGEPRPGGQLVITGNWITVGDRSSPA